MSAGEIIAILDAGPLIHLDELGSLLLLAGYREVLLPDIVEQEARKHRPKIQIDFIPGLVRVSSKPPAAESLFELAAEFGLHAGELAAIAVLKEHHGNCLLSDDAAARAMAEAIGFQVRGTVGLILRGWQRKQISKTAACDLLQALPEKSTLHLRPGFLTNVLEQINNQTG
jgi:predicted nucleic acid-binding protein